MNQAENNSRRPELDVAGVLSQSMHMLGDLEQAKLDRSQLPAKSLAWTMMTVGLVLTASGIFFLEGPKSMNSGLRSPAGAILIGSVIVAASLYLLIFVKRLSQPVKIFIALLLICCYAAALLVNGAMPVLLLPAVVVMFHLFFDAGRALTMSFLAAAVSVAAIFLDASMVGAVSARIMLCSVVVAVMMQALSRQVSRSYGKSLRVSAQLSTLVDRLDEMLDESHSRLDSALRTDIDSGLMNTTGFDDLVNSRFMAGGGQARYALLFIKFKGLDISKSVLSEGERKAFLKMLCQRLWHAAGSDGSIGRAGRSDFMVLLKSGEGDGILDGARLAAILKSLEEPIHLREHTVLCNPFIGMSVWPTDGQGAEELRRKAETAAQTTAADGSKRILAYDASMHSSIRERLKIVSGIKAAIDTDQFVLEYQPVFDLGFERFNKVEALIRWNHPELGRIPPNRFIPMLDDDQLVQVTSWVLNGVSAQLKRWHAKSGIRMDVAVNIPSAYLQDRIANQELFFRHLDGFDRKTGSLIFEITESSLFEAGDDALEFLAKVRRRGFQVALDDFGTGFSNLRQLETLPLDILKIDKSLIDEIDASERKMALCGYIIRLGHELGLKVVAEGIETENQRDALIWAGCNYGQGYLFSRPQPPERIPDLFHTGEQAIA